MLADLLKHLDDLGLPLGRVVLLDDCQDVGRDWRAGRCEAWLRPRVAGRLDQLAGQLRMARP
jgi:hypothetical protein